VNGIVRDVVERTRATTRQLSIGLEQASVPLFASGDPDRLRQAVQNVLGFITGTATSGGHIAVTTRPEDHLIVVGIGSSTLKIAQFDGLAVRTVRPLTSRGPARSSARASTLQSRERSSSSMVDASKSPQSPEAAPSFVSSCRRRNNLGGEDRRFARLADPPSRRGPRSARSSRPHPRFPSP